MKRIQSVAGSFFCLCVLFLLATNAAIGAQIVRLDELSMDKIHQDYGRPQTNRSFAQQPLTIGGRKFEHGVGTHADMTLWLDVGGAAQRFEASVGVDDEAGAAASVIFKLYGDGRLLWQSGVMRHGDKAKDVNVSLKRIRVVGLIVNDADDGIRDDHADWAEARFLCDRKPQTIDAPPEPKVILTPKPGLAPRINGPAVYGCRPGHPFVYRIPCQGERPMIFAADDLPAGLKLDATTGIIAGTSPGRGEYGVALRAMNSHGKASRLFKIISGDTLALTPPMGWNDWYAHYDRITDKLMRAAADKLESSGMADVGYQYVNIDDCWMNAPTNRDPSRVGPLRDEQGNILPNRNFPDMKALTDYIHGQGLKAGIYSSPGPFTCARFAGSYQHEAQDARTFARWGFDFLKYDWCSYGSISEVVKPSRGNILDAAQVAENHKKYMRPYKLMGDELKRQPRDMLFNLCQYGMDNVWEWGVDVGAQSWRTSGDLGFELSRIMDVALANAKHRDWSKPGAWNDPDYIQIGRIGSAREMGQTEPCPLTPNEQYSFMSLWCLMAAPLFYSGDLGTMDDFTLNVLCNPEVIEVDQDPLGQCARVIKLSNEKFLMVKDMSDGSTALGLCNRGEAETKITARWSELGINGTQRVRDLWREKDLGRFRNEFRAQVPRHGVVLVRIRPAS